MRSLLELAGAWRVENHDLYSAYKVAKHRVLAFAGKVAVRGDSKARIRKELYASASKLPGDLEKGCNELLHGTKPGALLCLVPCCFVLLRSLPPPCSLYAKRVSWSLCLLLQVLSLRDAVPDALYHTHDNEHVYSV